jgi:type IV secretory pathway component VirB8
MDDISRSISQYVKSGKYYEDTRTWYVNRFIMPVSERSYLMILTAFYMVVLLIGFYYYGNTNPAAPQVGYLVFTNDISKTYSVVNSPGDDKNTPQARLTKYILESYVENRESYNIKNLHKQLDYVRNTTVHNQYLRYEDMTSINNPFSPMMTYRDLYTKSIRVHKVDILNSSLDNMHAMVYFQSTLKNIDTNDDNNEEYVATIDFKIDNVKDLMKQGSKRLKFLVVDYELHKIKDRVK